MLKTTDQYNWDLMSDIGSNQLASFYYKIIRKPINPSRKEKSLLLAMIMKQSLGIMLISHNLRTCLIETT